MVKGYPNYLHLSRYMLLQKVLNGNLIKSTILELENKYKHFRNIIVVYIEHVKFQLASFNSN